MPDTDISILELWWAETGMESGELRAEGSTQNTVWAQSDINYLYLNTQYLLWVAALITVIKKTMQRLWIMSFNFVQLLPVKNQKPLDGVCL